MACFVAPMAAAAAITILGRKIPARMHPGWLAMMLWASSAALVVDHALNGELSIYPPFLTALGNPSEWAVVVREIAVTGGLMTLTVVALWGAMIAVNAFKAARHVQVGNSTSSR